MKKRLGDLLIQEGKITKEQLRSELLKQKGTGKRLGELLIEDKVVTEEDILEVLEKQLNVSRVRLDSIIIKDDVIKLVPENIAQKYTLMPIGVERNKLKVAMADPLNIFAIDDVKISSGLDVEPYITSSVQIKNAIDRYYSNEYIQKAAEDLSKQQETIEKRQKSVKEISIDEVKHAPAVRLVDLVINNAVKMKASDIHIEPFEEYIKVRYRIDGNLREIFKYNKDIMNAFITRIKILSNMDIAEKRVPQDGRILMKIEDKPVDLRVSTLPTIFGEKVVMRILDRSNFLIGMDKLGMRKDDMEKLHNIIKSPYGIVLVTGPTGSGKSTTLYTVLNELNDVNKNIVTVEDPVEYMMEGINQVNVNVKAGLTFASALRSILRQDPDIVMIGEIRDNETAEIATRAAITGHLVLSTIHTNDAPSTVVRLIDMGIEPYLAASSISGIISQRLVKKICPYCRYEYEADKYIKEFLNIDKHENVKLYKGKGCPHCSNTGYIGRVGVYEIMEITKEHRQYISEGKDTTALRELSLRTGMKTLKQSCKELVLDGITTMDELFKISFLKE